MSEAQPEQALKKQPREKGTVLQYAWDFNKHFWKDAKFQARWNAVSRGFIFMAQAVGLILTLSAAPLAIQALSIAGGTALAGIGALAVVYGTIKSWASLEGLCAKSFPKFNPLRKIRQRALKVPFVKKLIEKRPFKNKRFLSPAQQEVFLAGVTLEGSVAAGAYLAVHTAQHVAGLAALTVASLGTVGMVWASAMVAWCAYDAVCCVKTLGHTYSKHKKNKKALASQNTPAPAENTPPVQEAKPKTDLTVKTAPAFNTEATRKDQVQAVKQEIQAATLSAKPFP